MLVHKPLLRQAALFPGREAIHHRGKSTSWGEFARSIIALASGLARSGVRPGDRFAVLSGNDPSYLELYYALPMIGAIIVPLNTRLSAREIRANLDDCRPRGLAVGEGWEPLAREVLGSDPPDLVVHMGEGDPAGFRPRSSLAEGDASDEVPLPGITDDEICGIFYTGGTTGRSKGVCLTHKNLTVHAYQLQSVLRYEPADRYLHLAPMFHIADLASTFILTQVGGVHHFSPGFDPATLAATIDEEKITCTLMVPTMLNLFVQQLEALPARLPTFRQILYGGSPIPADRLERAGRVLGCRLNQGYGMTEASPTLTVLDAEDHRRRTDGESLLLESAGRPVLGVEVRVADPVGRTLPAGEAGEILARGPNIMKGYWDKPEETARALRDGWYHTGDLGRFDAKGYLYLLDRLDDKIVSGGENIYTTEVEAILYQHPDVVEACVVSAPDELWGERVVAVVVKRPGSALDEVGLRDFCRGKIGDFKIPKSVHFRETLPRSGPGKFLKREIREEFWKGRSRRVN